VNIKPPYGVRVINVVSAKEMEGAILNGKGKYDLLVMNAAVSDWRFKKVYDKKIKRGGQVVNVELVENDDILKKAAKSGRFRFTIGFAAESEDIIRNAKDKIAKKGIDGIVVNDVKRSDVGFASDFNEGRIILKDGIEIGIERCTKREMAYKIFEAIYRRL
jgi:phosphopantothenoylcysteine decarboxylase/phosphopantothenate--cysteine ligase